MRRCCWGGTNSASASGLPAVQNPATTATSRHAALTATDHHRIRYSAAGIVREKNRSTCCQLRSCGLAIRARARTSTTDRCDTSAGSGAVERSTERWVAPRR
jgi:hypothetical protein